MKRTMILSAVTAVGLLCAAGQAQVVISQVYGGGGNTGAPFRADFIELKNIGNAPVDITGWTVQRASAVSTGTTGNFTAGQSSTPFPAFTLQPGQYYLVECATGTTTPTGPVLPSPNHVAANMTMGANDGKIALVSSAALVSITNPVQFDQTTLNPIYSAASPLVDFVGYGANASHFEGVDGTPNTSNTLAAIRNENGCQDTNDNLANFTIGAPSPHTGGSIVACGAAYPDLNVVFSAVTCNPTVGGSYEVSAVLNNTQALAAAGTVVTFVIPPTLNYTTSSAASGTTSYNAANRTLTWTVGTLGASATTNITINGTVVAKGGLNVTALASTTTPNDPIGDNDDISYNEVLDDSTAVSVVAIGNATEATVVDENGFPRQLGNIYRSFVSQNGEWTIFRTDLAGLPGETNGGVIIGHNVAGVWTYTLVAREGTTAPVAAIPTALIDNSGVNNIQGINNSGQYVYSTILRQPGTPNDTLIDAVIVGSVASGVTSSIVEGAAAVAPGIDSRTYTALGSTTIQNDGTVSYMARLSGDTSTNAVFLTDNGQTILAQKGITVPTGSTTPLDFLDSDGSSDGRGLMVSADGNSWIGTAEVQTTGNTTTDDNVVIVNGTMVVREGSTYGSIPGGAVWTTFGTQQIPWVQMQPDGHYFIHGTSTNASFNSGQDWVSRDGTVLSATGNSIFGTSTETWADNFLQRTFVGVTGNGDDFVVAGLTNRSTTANGSDDATDGVITFRGTELLVREGAPVQYAEGDTRYLNIINDNRSFIAGGKLYVTATLRNANSYCSRSFSNLPQVIVAVTLPTVNPPSCIADIGVAGGEPGQDGLLDNNDFIAFITYFFAQDPIADMGVAGGEPGSDSLWDNNDFIAFINHFFDGCP